MSLHKTIIVKGDLDYQVQVGFDLLWIAELYFSIIDFIECPSTSKTFQPNEIHLSVKGSKFKVLLTKSKL